MSPLFETIKVKNNVLVDMEYHQQRVDRSCFELMGIKKLWDLKSVIQVPELDSTLTYRCKFIYDEVDWKTEFFPYTMKPLHTLKIVYSESISYPYKYLNRAAIDQLLSMAHGADDIIIVRGGEITDCSYANLLFGDGHQWITPENPLLPGTKRQRYLDEQIISSSVLKITDLQKFSKIKVINAMIDLEESPEADARDVQW